MKQEGTEKRRHEGPEVGSSSHSQAEEPAAGTAVMLDHVRAVDFTKHHEGHPAGGPHGLPLNGPAGTRPQLTGSRTQHQQLQHQHAAALLQAGDGVEACEGWCRWDPPRR